MALVCSVCLFSLACNLDTLVLALSFGCRRMTVPLSGCVTLAAVTTLVTALSLLLGGAAGAILPPASAVRAGGTVLTALGGWMILDWLRSRGHPRPPSPGSDWLGLSAALAFNNAGAGLAAGAAGLPPLWGGIGTFVCTLLLLPVGLAAGRRWQDSRFSALAPPLSGLLLLLLGLGELRF